VAEDHLADVTGQAGGEESISHAGDCFQTCLGDLGSQGFAVLQGAEGVRGALARHGAHTFWGLLTRTAATFAAHTLLRVCLTQQ
jgi:hypothetical protein